MDLENILVQDIKNHHVISSEIYNILRKEGLTYDQAMRMLEHMKDLIKKHCKI